MQATTKNNHSPYQTKQPYPQPHYSGEKQAHPGLKNAGNFSPHSGTIQAFPFSPTGVHQVSPMQHHTYSPGYHPLAYPQTIPQYGYAMGHTQASPIQHHPYLPVHQHLAHPQMPPYGNVIGHTRPIVDPYYQPTPLEIYTYQQSDLDTKYMHHCQSLNKAYTDRQNVLADSHLSAQSYDQKIAELNKCYEISQKSLHQSYTQKQSELWLQYQAIHYAPGSQEYMSPQTSFSNDVYTLYPEHPGHLGMSPLGTVKASKLGQVGQKPSKAIVQTGVGKPSAEEVLVEDFQGLQVKESSKQGTLDSPPSKTMLQRATSDGQKMTDAIKTFITPTSAHVMTQVPAKYPELLTELETVLRSSAVKRHMPSQTVTPFMQMINDTIIRSFYSQVTNRLNYAHSSRPSPTTLLTVIYEIQDKKNIKNKDHAQKLGITLRNIKEVMTTLRQIRDDQKDTPEGRRLSELSGIFVAFFNKIGVLSVEALEIYEEKMKTRVSHTNLPELKAFFQAEVVVNEQVFSLYLEQTHQKSLISTDMTPKKIKFRKDTHKISQRLQTAPHTFTTSLSSLIEVALTSGQKVSQKERKEAARLAKMPAATASLEQSKIHEDKDIEDNTSQEPNPNDVSFEEADLAFLREEYYALFQESGQKH